MELQTHVFFLPGLLRTAFLFFAKQKKQSKKEGGGAKPLPRQKNRLDPLWQTHPFCTPPLFFAFFAKQKMGSATPG
jgi:hypothetical protein